jgi:hypothetical protein
VSEEPVERRRQSDTMLAGSSPDVNHLFREIIDKFMGIGRWYGIVFAGWLSNFWVLCAIGVPAMLSAAVLLDKYMSARAADREFQLQMFELQTDVEIKKLDRTLLGDQATKTLGEISKKLDQQGAKLDQQGAQIAKVVADVETVKNAQDATARRLAGVAAKQGQLERRISQPVE